MQRVEQKHKVRKVIIKTVFFRNIRREQLQTIILCILSKNKDLHYYQGFHDFVSVFLITLGQNLGFYCSNIASEYFIKDFMREKFEIGVIPAFNWIQKLVEIYDPELYDLI